MRIIFFGLFFLFLNSLSANAEMLYCINKESNNVYIKKSQDASKGSIVARCSVNLGGQPDIEIPYDVYSKIRDLDEQYVKNLKSAPDKDKYDQEWNAATRKIILESTEQIENFNKQNLAIYKRNLENQARADQEAARLEQETKRKKELENLARLEKDHGRKCNKFSNKTYEYNSCLLEKDQLAKQEEVKKKQDLEKERNRLANLTPSERYAYTCEKTYGFKKGSDNFRDCVFKIMTTEHEMQTQINQRRIAELEARISGMERSTSASNSYNSEMLEIERMKAKAMQDQVNFARNKDVTDTLLGISRNLLTTPSRPAPNAPQMFNCQTRKFGGFDQIQCF